MQRGKEDSRSQPWAVRQMVSLQRHGDASWGGRFGWALLKPFETYLKGNGYANIDSSNASFAFP